jgi:HSP20 family molecular chaperone IbpA
MKTDIKETETEYELSIDMPGFDKKDINLTLENGYLSIEAKREEKEEENNYVKRERSFSCSRSYFVGDAVTEQDIKAKYNNGTLVLNVPKKQKELPKRTNIEIE